MAQQNIFETVCPACNGTFDVPADATQGNCPHCHAVLRFIEEENVPPPAAAAPAPAEAPTPEPVAEPEAALSSFEPVEPAPPEAAPPPPSVPEPGPGEFRIECPQCRRGFNVGAGAGEASCPACNTALALEDVVAERGIEFAVSCPSCGNLHEVPIDRHEGTCPHCQTRLDYDDVFAGETPTPTPPTPPFEPTVAAKAAVAAVPEVVSAPEPEPAAPSDTAPEPTPMADPVAEAPTAPAAEPDGIPLSIDCPSCKRNFSVPVGAREGNCPHCNVPLAFVSEREYLQFQEAEERKKLLQQKIAAKRARRKEREEAKRAKQEASQPEPEPVDVGAPAAPKRLFGIFPRKPASDAAPATVEAAEVVVEDAPILESARVEAAPAPAEKPKKRKGKAPEPEATLPPAIEPIVGDVSIELPAEPAPTETKAKKGKKAPEPAPAPVEAAIEFTASAEPAHAPLEFSEEVQVAAAPAEPPAEPARKGLFGRFRKEKPAQTAPPAEVTAEPLVMIQDEPAAAPALAPKHRKGRKEAAPPAVIETPEVEVSFDAPAEVPQTAKGRKDAPPAAIEAAEISMDADVPASAPIDVEIDMGDNPSAPAMIETGDIMVDAGDAPAGKPAKKRRR